jgi:hypothetical protein
MFYRLELSGGKLFANYLRNWWRIDHREKKMSELIRSSMLANPYRFENKFMAIQFQQGLPPEVGLNGVLVEDVIEVSIAKLESYQLGTLACSENEEAITALNGAKDALKRRRQRRMLQGVFNTLTPHQERTEDVLDEFSATGA